MSKGKKPVKAPPVIKPPITKPKRGFDGNTAEGSTHVSVPPEMINPDRGFLENYQETMYA
ncbi:MAG: hypothetical protein KC656_33910 [Myxococcales bacterium]|nr:hypothetical protein [Myxococcales bacterium]